METLAGLRKHVKIVIELLEKLGFVINYAKSWLPGYQILRYLEMILNTIDMMVSLPHDKISAIQSLGISLLKCTKVKIRTYASFICMCVATFPRNRYGQLHSKALEQSKNAALVQNDHDFDAFLVLSEQEKT